MSMTWAGYRIVTGGLGAAAPFLGWLAPRAERERWRERLGEVVVRAPAHAWIHAASLGESVAVQGLLRELRTHAPIASFHLTATTRTGYDRLRTLGEAASLAPLDAPQPVARFLGRVQPHRLFLIETELWPNWLIGARRLGIPALVLSARLSQRSVARYRWLGREWVELVRGLEAVLCQTEQDRERWLELGSRPERTEVVGNLKSDGLPEPASDRDAARRALGLDAALPVLVLGSLRPGEAAALGQAWGSLAAEIRSDWQVVAVPRHPHADAALRDEARAAGIALVDGTPSPGAWRWDARPGVLRSYYAVSDAAFVGGSLAPYGGHNPMEPAACGAAVLIGPHHASQAAAVAALAGALEIAPRGPQLAAALTRVLGDSEHRRTLGHAARRAADRSRGATRRAVDRLVEWNLWPA
jgi:3-deoxy-D-manno-octulosonic-acid transferase